MTTPLLDADQVQIGTANGPGIYLGQPGAARPPDAVTGWDDGVWTSLGYLSDDGPTIATSIDTEDLTPWQSVVPIRTIITAKSVTAQFVMWQINPVTVSLYFDTATPEGADLAAWELEVRSDTPQQLHAVGIDALDDRRHLRFVFPRAMLTDAGDMQIQRGAAIPLDVTLTALAQDNVLCWVMGSETATEAAFTDVVRQSPRSQAEAEQRLTSQQQRRREGGQQT